MAAAAEVQALLRFLTQDAKVPLAAALPKVGDLRKAQLNNAENIAKATLVDVKAVFTDEKLAKQILNAAKRVSNPKKRSSVDSTPQASKRARPNGGEPQDQETQLKLPTSDLTEAELTKTVIQTNRAPLVLAFAVVLLKYTMPEQPLSSRLSLAQAVVSANSQSKAKSIGLMNDKTAEDEGWGQGQPKVRVMGREIAVMRRAISRPVEGTLEESQATVKEEHAEQESDLGSGSDSHRSTHSAFWGLDLEALRKSNGPLVAGKNATGHTGLPIHSPQAARSYLLKSFTVMDAETAKAEVDEKKSPTQKKPTPAEVMAKKEQAAAIVFQALDLLYASWASTLSSEELDRRAWSWYVHVRPDIAQGQAGWGQKGSLRMNDILQLRKDP